MLTLASVSIVSHWQWEGRAIVGVFLSNTTAREYMQQEFCALKSLEDWTEDADEVYTEEVNCGYFQLERHTIRVVFEPSAGLGTRDES